MNNYRLNCMRRLINGEADFSILEPEDLVLASSNTDYNILVTHELRLFQAGNNLRDLTLRLSIAITSNKYCVAILEY